MKTYFTIAAVSLSIAIGGMGCYSAQSVVSQQYTQQPQYQDEQEVSADVFYNELSPYGRWVDYPNYGRVWISNERDFAPYRTGGHWAYTDYGWTWASDYAWGWAPFHYGRWISDPFYGWAWVPGYEWAPAWVSWRRNDSYYGWAPLSPGINISIGFGAEIPANQWCFVPNRYINNSNVRNYYMNNNQNVTIVNNTTIINNTNTYRNTKYISGPQRQEAERFTGSRINAIRINNAARPTNNIDNRGFNIYRPNVRNNNATNPSNVNENPRGNAIGNNRLPATNNNNLPNNTNRPMRPETAQRPDGNTMTTLGNNRPVEGNTDNDNRGNVGGNRNDRPSSPSTQTSVKREDVRPITIPPTQNTTPERPINRGNWGESRNERPSNPSQQTPPVRKDDTRLITIPPTQNTTPERPINRGNWGESRNERPSNPSQQTPPVRRDYQKPNNPQPPQNNTPPPQSPPQKREEKKPDNR